MSVCDRGGGGATPPTFAGAVRGHGEGALRLPECVGRRKVEQDKGPCGRGYYCMCWGACADEVAWAR